MIYLEFGRKDLPCLMLIMFVLIINDQCEWGQNQFGEGCPIEYAEVKVCQTSESCVNRERLLDLCVSLVCVKPYSPCQLCVLKRSGSKEEACENILNWLCGQTKINRHVYEQLETVGLADFCSPDFAKFVSQSTDFLGFIPLTESLYRKILMVPE